MRRLVVAVALALALAACDQVFGLDRGPGAPIDADIALPSCTQPPDEALRYTFVRTTTMFDLATASRRCNENGGELGVVNDEAERSFVNATFLAVASEAPILVGVTDEVTEGIYVGVDGCPADLYWGFLEPTGSRLENCVAIDGFGLLGDGQCDGHFGSGVTRVAACEAPRWPTEGCLRAAVTPGDVVTRGAMSHADAIKACRAANGHLIEIDSTAELAAAHQLAGSEPFWIGASYDGASWQSTTSCPQLFPWLTGEPTIATGLCVTINAVGAKVTACTDSAQAMCEVPSSPRSLSDAIVDRDLVDAR